MTIEASAHPVGAAADGSGFRHEALFYGGPEDFVAQTSALIHRWVDDGDDVFVMVPERKIELLNAALDGRRRGVRFARMEEIGRNPARIIPAWQDLLDERGGDGRTLRGIGEPVWAGRGPEELLECQQHEALLNLAFARSGPWSLVCAYDAASLPPSVLEDARRTHPVLIERGVGRVSPAYRQHGTWFDGPLPEPARVLAEVPYDVTSLAELRTVVAQHAERLGLDRRRITDLVTAVNEVATNSIRHGGGHGTARLWATPDSLVCELCDAGRIDRPMAGRERPAPSPGGGLGLWLVNQMCDLVQIRSSEGHTIVRLHMRRDRLA